MTATLPIDIAAKQRRPDSGIFSGIGRRFYVLTMRWLLRMAAPRGGEPDALSGLYPAELTREDRFGRLMRDYDDMIRRVCFGYARTVDELDDLHQDALLNLWQGLPRFRGDSSIKTWIYRVTLNTCVSTLRSRSREPRAEEAERIYDVIDESDDRAAMIRELHESILTLAPVDKAIVLLWLDEFTYDEISQTMGLPRNTVATRLRRAKEKLKKLF